MPDAAPADAALDRRLDPAASSPLAVAFSGGSDSLATLLAARTWGDRVGRTVVALTVDHGLNAASARWTSDAQATAIRLGAQWFGLCWTGAKPTTGLPQAARQARHRLLAQGARAVGAKVILFGHTADDREESRLIRHETPGLGYLREWAPSPAWPEGRDLFVLRPMLHARRSDLRAWLAGRGLPWLDDPANADLRFARSRARAELALGGGGETDALGMAREGDLTGLLQQVGATDDGRLILARDVVRQAPPGPLRRLIGSAVLCASGGATPPRGAALDRLQARLGGAEDFTATLCGARIVADAQAVVFAREAGEARRAKLSTSATPLAIGASAVFDGRFELIAEAAGLSVSPLTGRLAQLQPLDAQAIRRVPAYARGALPALLDAAGAVSLPAPFGGGPAQARSLVGRRLARACGAVRTEAQIDAGLDLMAPSLSPPYVGR